MKKKRVERLCKVCLKKKRTTDNRDVYVCRICRKGYNTWKQDGVDIFVEKEKKYLIFKKIIKFIKRWI